MKQTVLTIAVALSLAACTTTQTDTINAKTQQVAARAGKDLAGACPLLQAVVDNLDSPLVVLPVGAKADLDVAKPIVDTACSVAYGGDLSALVNIAIPKLDAAIMQSPGISTQARDNLIAAQIIVSALYGAQQAAKAGGTTQAAAK